MCGVDWEEEVVGVGVRPRPHVPPGRAVLDGVPYRNERIDAPRRVRPVVNVASNTAIEIGI